MLGKSRLTAAGIALVATATIAACSSSSSGGGSGSTGATGGGASTNSTGGGTATGSTIKLGMISDVGTLVDFTDSVAAAKAAVRGLNKRGGINGHKVELDFCNEALDPNKAQACARKMVSDKVMAMVGTQVVTAEQTTDNLFKQAGIPNVGPIAYGPSEQDSNSYLLSPGQEFINASQAIAAVKYGGKQVGWIREDLPFTVPFINFYKKALPMAGGTYGSVATVPATGSPDYSALAAGLVNGKADVINTNAAAIMDTSIFKQARQLGFKGKMVITADALSQSDVTSLGAAAADLVYTGPFPPVTLAAANTSKYPGITQFLSDMAAEKASGDKDVANYTQYVRTCAMDAYLAVNAVAKIASGAKATTSSSFKAAIGKATNVDLGGLIPNWNPNKSISKAIPRASYGEFYFSTLKNGALTALSPTPVDVTKTVDASMGG